LKRLTPRFGSTSPHNLAACRVLFWSASRRYRADATIPISAMQPIHPATMSTAITV